MQDKSTVIDRFVLKTRKDTNGCVLWTGGNLRGYGSFNVEGHTRSAHRVSYEIYYGPIPTGMFVLHNCPGGDNPLCVHPLHLWIGTGQDNMDDMVRKGRQARQQGTHHGQAKLTESDIEEIRIRCATGETQQVIADDFGINQSQVSNIARKKHWSHL